MPTLSFLKTLTDAADYVANQAHRQMYNRGYKDELSLMALMRNPELDEISRLTKNLSTLDNLFTPKAEQSIDRSNPQYAPASRYVTDDFSYGSGDITVTDTTGMAIPTQRPSWLETKLGLDKTYQQGQHHIQELVQGKGVSYKNKNDISALDLLRWSLHNRNMSAVLDQSKSTEYNGGII